MDSAKDAFRYLTGNPMSERRTPLPETMMADRKGKEDRKMEEEKGFWGNVAGLFGSLRSKSRGTSEEGRADVTSGKLWQEGEVHAELIRVSRKNSLTVAS